MNIYIGNLSYETAEQDVRQAFEGHGEVANVSIISDNHTGTSKGFGFVEMPTSEEANAAIQALDGTEMNGRTVKVSEARPRTERPDRNRSRY
jgi:RNA recognition motif-containing protein